MRKARAFERLVTSRSETTTSTRRVKCLHCLSNQNSTKANYESMILLCASLKRSVSSIAPGGQRIESRQLEGVAFSKAAESIGLEVPPKLADFATDQCGVKCVHTNDVDSGAGWVSNICGCTT